MVCKQSEFMYSGTINYELRIKTHQLSVLFPTDINCYYLFLYIIDDIIRRDVRLFQVHGETLKNDSFIIAGGLLAFIVSTYPLLAVVAFDCVAHKSDK